MGGRQAPSEMGRSPAERQPESALKRDACGESQKHRTAEDEDAQLEQRTKGAGGIMMMTLLRPARFARHDHVGHAFAVRHTHRGSDIHTNQTLDLGPGCLLRRGESLKCQRKRESNENETGHSKTQDGPSRPSFIPMLPRRLNGPAPCMPRTCPTGVTTQGFRRPE